MNAELKITGATHRLGHAMTKEFIYSAMSSQENLVEIQILRRDTFVCLV